MCGIAGIVRPPSRSEERDAPRIEAMVRCLRHRGPDDCGTWSAAGIALGHTRLSIIDLSAAGHQPMHDEHGRFVLVYNGEVYNYRELRRELEGRGHRFRSATDTEVVLAAYREWGPDCLQRFNGMWALAIWDREHRELFLARDRAGKKPLYYAQMPDGALLFASEVKALRAAGVRLGRNAQAAFDFLTQGTYGHLGDRGFFEGVAQLPAAHYVLVRPGERARPTRYWSLPVVAPRDRVPYDAALRARFRELLIDAVALRLRSDVPVGATLSGGLDSSTIVGIVNELTGGAPIHLFTSLYPGSKRDETPYFEAVVARLRRPIVHDVAPRQEAWREDLLRVLDHQEEPFGDTSIFAHFNLMRAARAEGVPVLLSGQGGDELLLGYPSLVNAYLGSLLARGRIAQVLRESRTWGPGVGVAPSRVMLAASAHALPLGVRDRLRSRWVARQAERVAPALREQVSFRRFEADSTRGVLDSYVAQMFTRFSIPHLVHYDDRNAMAFAVEGRMPFLDVRVIELLGSVSFDALFADGVTKRVLRDAFADLLPPIVRDRRDKVGFHTPLGDWLRRAESWVRTILAPERVRAAGVLEPDRCAARLDALMRGDEDAALEVWRGFVYHLWMERFDLLEAPAPVSGRHPVAAPVALEASA